MRCSFVCVGTRSLLLAAASVFVAWAGPLQVGAAKVDITPAEGDALPMSGFAGREQGFQGIHDKIYARAIALNDGATPAAIVALELIGIPNTLWQAVSDHVAREMGIAPENLMLAAVHTHSAPSLGRIDERSDSRTAAYTEKVKNATLEAIRQSMSRLQPARVGAATGKADVNINRREYMPERGWWLGHNPDLPSDKTLAVVRFETLTGKPIALLINYAVHAVVMGQENLQISGDLAGAASRFVEQYFRDATGGTIRGDLGPRLRIRPEEVLGGDELVVLWTSGAAGDQNPTSLARGSNFALVEAFGQILGEEAIRVSTGIRSTPAARIRGVQQVITCAGRRLVPGQQRPRQELQFEDAEPVSIRLGLLTINQIALAGVSGEVLTGIASRLNRETPLKHTFMLTNANGSSGYIPDDAAFGFVSYEITASRLKPGCAESAIVTGFLDMMHQQ